MARRRRVYLTLPNGTKVFTPEFIGDKAELEAEKSEKSCDKEWKFIVAEFLGANTIERFRSASNRTQAFFHAAFGFTRPLPLESEAEVTGVDELYEVSPNGRVYRLDGIKRVEMWPF